jgi:hypothetical protein
MRDLERFVFDRLAERRNVYPKVTLLTIGEPGLRRRGLWSGKIKRFGEETAGSASEIRASYGDYYARLVTARTPA